MAVQKLQNEIFDRLGAEISPASVSAALDAVEIDVYAGFFERCREHLRYWEEAPGLKVPAGLRDLLVVWRSVHIQGVRGPYRAAYWRFLAWVLWNHPRKLNLALAQTCAGHHFITYTRDTVSAALRKRLESLRPDDA